MRRLSDQSVVCSVLTSLFSVGSARLGTSTEVLPKKVPGNLLSTVKTQKRTVPRESSRAVLWSGSTSLAERIYGEMLMTTCGHMYKTGLTSTVVVSTAVAAHVCMVNMCSFVSFCSPCKNGPKKAYWSTLQHFWSTSVTNCKVTQSKQWKKWYYFCLNGILAYAKWKNK